MFSFFKKTKNRDMRDLEQVIYDVAENQTGEDFHLLYELMADRRVFVPVNLNTLPKGIVPGEPYVTNSSDDLHMRYVVLPNGKSAVPACTNQDMSILKDGFIETTWVESLQMALKLDDSLYGVLLQGKTSWVAMDRDRIRYVLDLYGAGLNSDQDSALGGEKITVPEGHRVGVLYPTKNPRLVMLASGTTALDYGETGEWVDQNVQVETELKNRGSLSVVIVLQQTMIEKLKANQELEKLIAYWTAALDRGVSAVWVLPLQASTDKKAISQLKDACFGVFGSTDDGACFVEVHKPDGTITVGIPGDAL